MKHAYFYLTLSLLIFGCNNTKKETKTEIKSETVVSTPIETSKIGRNNYAVIWKWTTTDAEYVADNSVTISRELTELWKDDVIENAYYNVDSKVDKLAYLPNISFFLKAQSKEDAEKILNELTVVKKEISTYTLYPVGSLWLNRKHKTIHENGMTKSFVTVWKTNKKPTDELTQAQNNKVLELWKAGKIENAYFDIDGTQKPNSKIDFVFYANANTKEEATALCESLPFFKNNIATYKIHEVGVFWMGKYEQR